MSVRALLSGGLLLLSVLLGGCAWSNRANRPVWNAFEANVVPEDTTAFYATLPLTLPGGLLCILTDSFVVHPVQVADDAWADAGDIWDELEWEQRYYTSLLELPLYTVGTPVIFVVSFLGRSLFDVPPHRWPGEGEDSAAVEAERALERLLLDRLEDMAQARPESAGITLQHLDPPQDWTDELGRAFDDALEHGRALDRVQLYTYAQRHELPPWRADRTRGLRDPDPVVRYLLLDGWPRKLELPADAVAALRSDPDEAVRQLALQRWP